MTDPRLEEIQALFEDEMEHDMFKCGAGENKRWVWWVDQGLGDPENVIVVGVVTVVEEKGCSREEDRLYGWADHTLCWN